MVKNNLRAEDIVRNTSKITQLEEGKKINNQLKEWTRKLREPCRGVAGDVEEEEGHGRTEEGEEEDGRAGGQQGKLLSSPAPMASCREEEGYQEEHQGGEREGEGGRERFLTAAVLCPPRTEDLYLQLLPPLFLPPPRPSLLQMALSHPSNSSILPRIYIKPSSMSFSSPRTKLQTSAPLSLNSKLEEKLDHPEEGVGDHPGDAREQQLWTQAISPELLVKMRSQAIPKVLLIQMKPEPCCWC